MASKGTKRMIKLEECSEGKLWTVPEYSSFSGLSVPTIRAMMKSGFIKWVATGPGGKSRRIPHSEILRMSGVGESSKR